MISFDALIEIAPQVTAWLLTYAMHSTVLLGCAWLLTQFALVRGSQLQDQLWKLALVGSLFTATLHVFAGAGINTVGTLAATPQLQEIAVAPITATATVPPPTAALTSAEAAAMTEIPVAAMAEPMTVAPAFTLPWTAWVVLAWIAGIVLMGSIHLYRRHRFFSSIGDRMPVEDSEVVRMANQLTQRGDVPERLRRDLHITVAPHLASPIALGRCEICLPARALTDLSPEQLRNVIAHELAHLVRRDPQWLSIFLFLETVLFFQPLHVLGRHKQQEAAEYLCDSWAVAQTGTRKALAESLLEVASWMLPSGQPAFVSGIGSGSALGARVRRLVETGVNVKEWPRIVQLGALLTLMALVTWLAPRVVVSGADAVQNAHARLTAASGSACSPDGPGYRAEWQDGAQQYLAVMEGHIEFLEDAPSVVTVSPNKQGCFFAKESGPYRERMIKIDSDGRTLGISYFVDGLPHTFDSAAEQWLAKVARTVWLADLQQPSTLAANAQVQTRLQQNLELEAARLRAQEAELRLREQELETHRRQAEQEIALNRLHDELREAERRRHQHSSHTVVWANPRPMPSLTFYDLKGNRLTKYEVASTPSNVVVRSVAPGATYSYSTGSYRSSYSYSTPQAKTRAHELRSRQAASQAQHDALKAQYAALKRAYAALLARPDNEAARLEEVRTQIAALEAQMKALEYEELALTHASGPEAVLVSPDPAVSVTAPSGSVIILGDDDSQEARFFRGESQARPSGSFQFFQGSGAAPATSASQSRAGSAGVLSRYREVEAQTQAEQHALLDKLSQEFEAVIERLGKPLTEAEWHKLKNQGDSLISRIYRIQRVEDRPTARDHRRDLDQQLDDALEIAQGTLR